MATAAHSIKVFLAEDSLPIRARIAELLLGAGLLIIGEASTPAAAVAGILAGRPDVVVLDAQLLGGTGLDVLKAVRLAAPGIAFVVFSNNAGPAWRKRYLAEGARSFLDKSTEFQQLPAAVFGAAQPAFT